MQRRWNHNTKILEQIADKQELIINPESGSPPLEGCPTGGVVLNTTQIPIVLTTLNNIPIYRNFVENLPRNSNLNQLAKNKRKQGILSEVLFWQQVHKGIFHKIDFDRQRIIGNYIVDFYVKTLGLIIEIDGNSHIDKVEYDTKRQNYLESHGLKMYRIPDIAVKKNIGNVIRGLEQYIIKEYSKVPPRPLGTPPNEGNLPPWII
jgi:very-short-patch-repair endonuclease